MTFSFPVFGIPILVADSTPLIVMAKIGRLDLLSQTINGPRMVLIPDAVAQEVMDGPSSDPARAALLSGWGTFVESMPISDELRARHLGRGEEEALALAAIVPGALVVCDDAAGRRAAQALNVSFTGTLGVILQARQSGQIAEMKSFLLAIQNVGLFLPSEATLRTLLRSLGESWP